VSGYVLKCLVNLCDSLSPEDEALLVKPFTTVVEAGHMDLYQTPLYL